MIRSSHILATSKRHNTTIKTVHSSRFAQRLAKWLIGSLVVVVTAMAFLPWQQTSRGAGRVIAYAPQERQQSIDSPTKGVVVRIGKGLADNVRVKKGDFLVEIQPFAADMKQQLEAQLNELKLKLQTTEAKVGIYQRNIEGYQEAGEFAVSAALQLVESAKAKLKSKQDLIAAYTAKEYQAMLALQRQQKLEEIDLRAPKEIEKLQKDLDVAKSELQSVLQEVVAQERELDAKIDGVSEKRELAKTKVDSERAKKEDALGSGATIRKEMGDLELKLSEFKRREIRASRDGTIYRMPVYEQGQTVKEGESIMTLVPDTAQKAVELFINGNDLPLIKVGQEVRLQFEGWPAVQVAGWPSIAVGTFNGRVETIDATDDGKGKFRILVLPDNKIPKNRANPAWPEDDNRFLRQGVRANGWVVMNKVTLGWEFWRQLNGFPVILEEDMEKKDKNKPPKLFK